jgi:hypothetical protein
LKLKDFSDVGVFEKPGLSLYTNENEEKGLPALPRSKNTWLSDDSSSTIETEIQRFA